MHVEFLEDPAYFVEIDELLQRRAAHLALQQHIGHVFVVGMPKCGTTSLQHALWSAGLNSMHCYAPKPWGEEAADRFVGARMMRAVKAGREPLDYLPGVSVLTQMDCWYFDEEDNPTACFPQIELLEKLDESYPDARFIFNTRNTASWLRSVAGYGPLRRILLEARVPGMPLDTCEADDALTRWFEAHSRRVRHRFAGRGPGKYMEFSLEEPDKVIAARLMDFLGMPVKWVHKNRSA